MATQDEEPTPHDRAERPSLWRRAGRLARRLGPAGPLALAASTLPGLGGLVVYAPLGDVAEWMRAHPRTGPLAAAGAFGVVGGVALAPTYALSALCGWSFGFGIGLLATLAGFLLAALVGYSVVGALDVAESCGSSTNAHWRAIQRALSRGRASKVALIVSLVRFAPLAPFSLTNLVVASVRVPLPAYAIGTVLGMTPRTALIVFTASRLESLDAPPSEHPRLVALSVLATLAVAAVLGMIGKRALALAVPTVTPPITHARQSS